MQIKLEKIQFKNILSVGNTLIEIDLEKNPMTLVVGKNGNGKSTLIDAICFALFGKPFRKINKLQLVNSINEKELYTDIYFSSGSKKYRVERGIKPNIFNIFVNNNTTPLNQDSTASDYQKYLEEHILKTNFKTFTQIVVLGSASFTPFMQLSTSDRRIIIEDILDIGIFSVMKQLVKEKIVSLFDKIKTVDYDIKLCEEKILMRKKFESEQSKNKDDQKSIIQKELASLKLYSKNINNLISDERISLKLLQKKFEPLRPNPKEDSNKVDELRKRLNKKKEKLFGEMEFYSSNDNCPVCEQSIADDFKEIKVKEKEDKIDELKTANFQLLKRGDILKRKQKEYDKVESLILDGFSTLETLLSDMKSNDAQMKHLNSIIYAMKVSEEKKCSNDSTKKLVGDLEIIKTKQLELKQYKKYYEILNSVLNDSGIKARVIDRYLPVINQCVNKYLLDMDFYCNFTLDNEFNETIKSRYRDRFSYSSFSEGEKKRIDIALLLTWRYIASLKNSVNINLLFMDEIFDSSLDQSGVDDVMKVFSTLVDTNIFVVSHKGDFMEDKFSSKIDVFKRKQFTEMVQG